MVSIRDTLIATQDRFRAAGLDTPDLDARLLVQAALGLRHEDLILDAACSVAPAEMEKIEAMVARRLKHEPVSRILGVRGFWKSEFKVSPATLDPRPDSETLVEAVLKNVNTVQPLSILDLGTGTGCLLLSLLQELPQAKGVGIDISPDAVKMANENAVALNLTTYSEFMVNTWADFQPSDLFDIVISNPPYISEAEGADLAPEVRDYDPPTALFGGEDGLACYRDIVANLPRFLKREGLLFLEIGSGQAESVAAALAAGGLSVLQTLTDLAGHNRCIIARWSKA